MLLREAKRILNRNGYVLTESNMSLNEKIKDVNGWDNLPDDDIPFPYAVFNMLRDALKEAGYVATISKNGDLVKVRNHHNKWYSITPYSWDKTDMEIRLKGIGTNNNVDWGHMQFVWDVPDAEETRYDGINDAAEWIIDCIES